MNQPIEEELSDCKEAYALLFKEAGELRRERDAFQEEVNRLKERNTSTASTCEKACVLE